jgi:Zn-ribbon RNA-binding protein
MRRSGIHRPISSAKNLKEKIQASYYLLKCSRRDTLGNPWRNFIMSDKNCTSCNAPLAEEGATEFGCPACGVKINRCYRCREQSISYVCPKCGFGGP